MRNKLNDQGNELNYSRDTVKILEEKLANSEEEFYRESNKFQAQKVQLLDEMKLLKDSIKKSEVEVSEKG